LQYKIKNKGRLADPETNNNLDPAKYRNNQPCYDPAKFIFYITRITTVTK